MLCAGALGLTRRLEMGRSCIITSMRSYPSLFTSHIIIPLSMKVSISTIHFDQSEARLEVPAVGGGRFLWAFVTFKSQSFISSSRTSRTPEVFHLILPVSIVLTIRIQICKANNNNNNNLLTSHSGAAYGELLCVCFPRAFCQSLHFVSFLLICKASMRGQGFWFTVVEEKEVRT